MSSPTTHSAVYEEIATTIEGVNGVDGQAYTRDHHLLGNRQSPSVLLGRSFRLNPTGFVNTKAYQERADGFMRIEDAITVHLAWPMDVQQQSSWLAARASLEAVIKALVQCDLQVIDIEGADSGLSDDGNVIEQDIEIVVTYDLDVS